MSRNRIPKLGNLVFESFAKSHSPPSVKNFQNKGWPLKIIGDYKKILHDHINKLNRSISTTENNIRSLKVLSKTVHGQIRKYQNTKPSSFISKLTSAITKKHKRQSYLKSYVTERMNRKAELNKNIRTLQKKLTSLEKRKKKLRSIRNNK